MKVEQEKTKAHSVAGSAVMGEREANWKDSVSVAEVLAPLSEGLPRFVARAPGRLDVMGGLAEYTGSLVLNMPVGEHVCVALQRSGDENLSILSAHQASHDGGRPTVIPLRNLHGDDGVLIGAELATEVVEGSGASRARRVVGAVVELLRTAGVPSIECGLTVVVGSGLEDLPGTGRDAAIVSATLVAAAELFGVALDPLDAAAVCQRVENHWLAAPVGLGDAFCALLGKPGTLAGVCCETCSPAESVRLPDNLVLLGIGCGTVHPDAKLRYSRVRTAAFMGRALIERIIRHDGLDRVDWNGYLSRVSLADFVERFRDRIPTKLRGSEYLERFGETGDPLTRVEPDFIYKIRSRTEHHIYEHARACQFIDCLSKASSAGGDGPLLEAGELMYASHWSYGQRCGLGSIETDLIVNLIRSEGAAAGIYGAKITARGCGGTVAVLMRAGESGSAAIHSALERYQSKTGRPATLLRGSTPGAIVSGVQRFD